MRVRVQVTKEERERLAAHWSTRALLEAEKAEIKSGDRLFRILCAALKLPPAKPPWIGPSAVILPDPDRLNDPKAAFVCANVLTGEVGDPATPRRLCTVQDLADNLNRLADALDFKDAERLALFNAVQKWVVIDDREGNRAEDRIPAHLRNKT